ncbi:MAG TPA: AraC family transcriptional regulator [Chitinophagaceae bacterium]|nr:AraC family transcriptional regulator [Chitinophagaceae bacterium]
MKQPLIPLSHKLLEWKETFPSAFKGVHLPGATVLSAAGNFGSVCIQEYHDNDFSVRLNVLDLFDRFIVKSFFKRSGVYARLILKGRIDHEASMDIKWSLYRNQFALIQSRDLITKEIYEKNTHISFETYFSSALAKEILLLYPSYNPQQVVTGRWADLETLELVHTILHCKYNAQLRHYFFKSRVKDLFFKYLLLDQRQLFGANDATENEINAIHEAEKIITANVALHNPIPDLAKKVHLNEFKFKQLFKKIFAVGPYEYLVKKRLEKGKLLLEAGLSVKEVAAQVGYRPSDFTTVFRNHFGVSPSMAKRKD